MRLVEASAALREAYPEAYADLAVLVTELGGVTGLVFLLSICYWVGRRRETALVVSVATAGLLFVLVVKTAVGLPRPPADVALIDPGDEYGFPSGHAFAATLVYGGLAYVYDRHRRPGPLAAVAALVALVSLSRVILGVHYLGDLVAGVALGVAFLAAALRIADGDPRRGFALAAVLGLPALVVAGPTEDVLTGVGGAVGGLAAAGRIDDAPPLRSRAEGAALVVVGLAFVLAVGAAESVVAVHPVAVAALNAVLFAGIVLVPVVPGWIDLGPLGPAGTR